jgi:hypothetical protein
MPFMDDFYGNVRVNRRRQGGLCAHATTSIAVDSSNATSSAIVQTCVRERSEAAKNAGYYFRSQGLQSLAIEAAEAWNGYTGESGRIGDFPTRPR